MSYSPMKITVNKTTVCEERAKLTGRHIIDLMKRVGIIPWDADSAVVYFSAPGLKISPDENNPLTVMWRLEETVESSRDGSEEY